MAQMHLLIFEDENHKKLRSIDRGGEIWFVAKDVCDLLGLSNVSEAISRLDDDEKDDISIADVIGRTQTTAIISEPGVYSLILTSRRPEAKAIKRWITHEVIPAIRKTGAYTLSGRPLLPVFVRRFNDNWNRVPVGHFSIINEVFIRFYGRMEHEGYVMPDKSKSGIEMRPDVSVGKRFASWLTKNHNEWANSHKMYEHLLPDGKIIPARAYPNEMWPIFIEFFESVWIRECAADYLRARDLEALPYFNKILPPPPKL